MRIRTQLILVMLLLAVVPLAGIVLYSYLSSQRALREAVEAEAAALTRDMEERMAAIEGDLDRRVERVGALPFWRRLAEQGAASAADEAERADAVGALLSELGEAAPLLRSIEFVPAPAPAPAAPGAPAPPPAPAAPARWMIDLDEAMAELEKRLELDLPPLVRSTVVRGLRMGAEQMREVGIEIKQELADELAKAAREAEEAATAHAAAEPETHARLEELERRHPERFAQIHKLHERRLEVPIVGESGVLGSFRAEISGEEVLGRVLGLTRRDQGEIPFALGADGELITLDEDDREQIARLPIHGLAENGGETALANWVVVTREEPTSGLTFGIARPIRESLAEVRSAAARNFGYGLLLVGIALVGILPLSRRMTRGLNSVTESAERIAQGDLATRVPVRGRGEIGQLANAFNRMAFDLERQQERLVEEERRRRDQEVRQQLLEAENRRKGDELEEARRFQLSLLPRSLPEHPGLAVAVAMRTATEVGGDYYDFRSGPDGALVVAVGDATGHGARAGTMVTVIKSLFSARPPGEELAEFLAAANDAVRRMELGRMAMALCLARFAGGRLTFASAGMPPALVRRAADGRVEELAAQGMPLGGLAGDYDEIAVELAPGDLVLLMSDGLPELPDAGGDPLGYEGVRRAVAETPGETPQELIAALLRTAEKWAGEGPPADDITFVALKVR